MEPKSIYKEDELFENLFKNSPERRRVLYNKTVKRYHFLFSLNYKDYREEYYANDQSIRIFRFFLDNGLDRVNAFLGEGASILEESSLKHGEEPINVDFEMTVIDDLSGVNFNFKEYKTRMTLNNVTTKIRCWDADGKFRDTDGTMGQEELAKSQCVKAEAIVIVNGKEISKVIYEKQN